MKVKCLRNCFVGGRLIEKGAFVDLPDELTASQKAIYGDPVLFSGLPKEETPQKPQKEKPKPEGEGEDVPEPEGEEPENASTSEVRQALEALAARHGVKVTHNMKDETIRERLKALGVEVQ